MPFASRLIPSAALLVLTAGLLVGCGHPGSTPYPMEQTIAPIEARAQGSSMSEGTYRLTAIRNHALPAEGGMDEGCSVHVHEGTLNLTAAGRYRLELTAQSLCETRAEATPAGTGPATPGLTEPIRPAGGETITVEGFYRIEGNHLRFGDRISFMRDDERAPESYTGSSALRYALLPYGRMSARGTLRSLDALTVTLDGLVPYTFVRA